MDSIDRWQAPRAGESYYQRDQRVAAESKVAGLERRYDETTVRLFVRELLRNSRSPSKRPVYIEWLEAHPEGGTNDQELTNQPE